MRQPVTLIFDIGKTTKKALVFDARFNVLEERTETLEECRDDDGFPCEDLDVLHHWIADTLAYFVSHPEFCVTHLNISAYGASIVCIGGDGEPVLPFYNYLKPFPEEVKEPFLRKHDRAGTLSSDTASPLLGMLNSGLQAYWLKYQKPEHFRKTHFILHFPQYLAYRISGKMTSELTGIGCHTMLWDFRKMEYHEWVRAEGLDKLFPGIVKANTCSLVELHEKKITVGVGIHDSSAALMPYLHIMKEPFLLLSTGTWNICFNPFAVDPLTETELKKDCLSYLTYHGSPVKASRIFLGHEHDLQQKELAKHFTLSPSAYKAVKFDESIFRSLSSSTDPRKTIYSLGMEGTGPLHEREQRKTNYSAFDSFEEAQHQLVRTLVQWQRISINLVDPHHRIRNIILVGGFAKSAMFMEIMKREIPERTIMVSDHPRASALGAAWLVNPPDEKILASEPLKITPL